MLYTQDGNKKYKELILGTEYYSVRRTLFCDRSVARDFEPLLSLQTPVKRATATRCFYYRPLFLLLFLDLLVLLYPGNLQTGVVGTMAINPLLSF